MRNSILGLVCIACAFLLCRVFPPAVVWWSNESSLCRMLWFGFAWKMDRYELANTERFDRWHSEKGELPDALGLTQRMVFQYRLETETMVHRDLDEHIGEMNFFLAKARSGPQPLRIYTAWSQWVLVYGVFVAGLFLWVRGLRRRPSAVEANNRQNEAEAQSSRESSPTH